MIVPSTNGQRLAIGSELPANWDELAVRTPSPFLTRAWLDSWWMARGKGERVVVTLAGMDGTPVAAAFLARTRFGALQATGDEHSGDWGLVATDDEARSLLLREIARLDAPKIVLGPLRDSQLAGCALADAGRRVRYSPGPRSPYLQISGSFDELLATRSANLRSQFRRRRRALERTGELRLRTTTGGPDLDRDLEALLQLEASGWKSRNGTAMLSQPDTARLYRTFANAAATDGWLRLHLLEHDGIPIAGDLGCAIGGEGFLVKTGFDEGWAGSSPGLVLRGEVLRHCIEEGLSGYDFLGGPEPHKLRWTDRVRPRSNVHAYKGLVSAPDEAWRHGLRPALARGRRAQARRKRR